MASYDTSFCSAAAVRILRVAHLCYSYSFRISRSYPRDFGTNPLLRVIVKFTVRIALCMSLRVATYTGNLTVILTLTLKSGVVTLSPCSACCSLQSQIPPLSHPYAPSQRGHVAYPYACTALASSDVHTRSCPFDHTPSLSLTSWMFHCEFTLCSVMRS